MTISGRKESNLLIMKLKGLFTFFISKLRLPHLHNIIPTYIFLADGAGLSQQVGFAEHVFEAMHTKKHSTVAWPIFTSGIEIEWSYLEPFYYHGHEKYKVWNIFTFYLIQTYRSCFMKGLNPGVISKVGWVWSSGWTLSWIVIYSQWTLA